MSALATLSQFITLRCSRDDLLVAIQAASSCVARGNENAALCNIRLHAHDQQLDIYATDAQVGICSVVKKVDVQSPGDVIIPPHHLIQILKESKSLDVRLKFSDDDNNNLLHITLDDGNYDLPVIVGCSFPSFPVCPDEQERLLITQEHLSNMLRKTLFAVDHDRSSAVLSGAYLYVQDCRLSIVATDGKILSETSQLDERYKHLTELAGILPSATCAYAQKLMNTRSEDEVALTFHKKIFHLQASINDHVHIAMHGRTIDGTYPNYKNALTSNPLQKIAFQVDDLLKAVKRTTLMTSSQSRGIILNLKSNHCELSNMNHIIGTAHIPIDCVYEGEDMRFALNGTYLTEVLKASTLEQCSFFCNGPNKGIIIEDVDATFLIMPITLPS